VRRDLTISYPHVMYVHFVNTLLGPHNDKTYNGCAVTAILCTKRKANVEASL